MNRRPPHEDETGRATKVENLLVGQRSFAVSSANNAGDHPQQQSTASPGATAGSSHNVDHAQKPSPLTTGFAATNGQSQPGSQQPSVPSSPFAARQVFDGHAENGPQRTFNGQFPPQQTHFRRQRQHAATISEPMPPQGVVMRTTAQQTRNLQQPPPQHQQFPRFEQQPPGQQETRPYQQHRPRQLSLAYPGGPHDQPRDQYETSFSRSTSHAGVHFGSAQASPQAPYFAPNSAYGPRGPPQQLGPPQHPGYGPPPPHFQSRASFSHVGPRMPSQRSLSPPPPRGHMPPGRFDPNAQQRSPLPFPRIPSPNPQQLSQQPLPQQPRVQPLQASPGRLNPANTSQSPARESTRRLSSVVWGPTGFERLDSGMSRCRICKKEYSKGSSTGTLKRHFRQHQCNVGPGQPYPMRSPPTTASSTRPRSFSHSHRGENSARREASPPFTQMCQPPMSSGIGIGGPLFTQREASDIETSSAIAGSALLSMAAGDGINDSRRMIVDQEPNNGRRPMRSSDPSVYQQGAEGAPESGTRDISVSPSPSSTSSTQPRTDAYTAQTPGMLGSSTNNEIQLSSDTTSSSPSDLPLAQQQLAQAKPPFAQDISGILHMQDLEAVPPSQAIALAARLVQRVAAALPTLDTDVIMEDRGSDGSGAATDPFGALIDGLTQALTRQTNGSVFSPPLPFKIRKPAPLNLPNHSTTANDMSLLSRVSNAMQRIAPLSLAALEWDNVGILLEAAKPRPDAKRVLLTIDLTTTVLAEALEDPSVGVIVSYHPPIFSAWKSLSMGNLKQNLVLQCAANGVSIYSPHTSLDSCANGVNDWLASLIGPGTVTPITPAQPDRAGGQENVGEGRILQLAEPKPLSTIIGEIKKGLKLEHIRVARAPCHAPDEQKLIERIAICAGSGASVL
ncbi:hypothetical protein EC988_000183, partial [Linderina pennispora]